VIPAREKTPPVWASKVRHSAQSQGWSNAFDDCFRHARSRNGRDLFYENPNDKHIWVTTYAAKGDTFTPDKPRVWSEGQVPRSCRPAERLLETTVFGEAGLGPGVSDDVQTSAPDRFMQAGQHVGHLQRGFCPCRRTN
jgi:hypothetical protein